MKWTAAVALASAAVAFCCAQRLTPEQELGKDVFRACSGCHNVLTDARKAGPSLRTLFGKVRLRNGKRAIEDNVAQVILDGKDAMPSYRHMFAPELFQALMSYLKTLRARPEVEPVLAPIRGSDEEVLAAGKRLHADHCGSCHDAPESAAPGLIGIVRREAAIVPRIVNGHSGMPPKRGILDEAALFRLIAFLKAE